MQRKSIRIIDSGSIVLIEPLTRRAASWIEENIGPGDGFQPYHPTIVCEPRFVADILDGMAADGLRW